MAGLLDYAGIVLLLAVFMTAHAVAVGGILFRADTTSGGRARA